MSRNVHAHVIRVPGRAPRLPPPGDASSRSGFIGISSPNYHLEDLAYAKLILHALKYPHQTVNGVILGHLPSSGIVVIVDAVPLQHHWTNLSPMMEVGLGMAANHAHSRGLHVVGYYQAAEHIGDTTLSPTCERIAAKIKETFQTPVVLVLDGSKLDDTNGATLVTYLSSSPSSTIFRPVQGRLRFNWALSTRVLPIIRHSSILAKFADFDDYLEDNRVPFLTNGAVQVTLNPPQ